MRRDLRRDAVRAAAALFGVAWAVELVRTRDRALIAVGAFALGLTVCAALGARRSTGAPPGQRLDDRARTEPATEPATGPGTGPGTNPATAPETAPGTEAVTGPVTRHRGHDQLTGVLDRQGAIDALERALDGATPANPVGLIAIDLDRFTHVNDALGHRAGDRFIQVVADRLVRSIDAGATAGRTGGDELIAVLPGYDLTASLAVANRVAAVLGHPVHVDGREMPSSVSIGVAVGPVHGGTSTELLRHAGAALHRAKAGGRGRVDAFDGPMLSELTERLESEQALRRALDGGDITAFFQPEIDATTGHVVGAELLARWIRRDGTVSDAIDFIDVAAQAGLLERLTEHVMQEARPVIRKLSALGLPDGFRFRINLPPRATERSWRENPLDGLIQGIEPRLLTVDVTEAAVANDLAAAAANLAAVRGRGVRVCLDDFARGVSSLSLLRRLPLDEVRIDRMSIDTITVHPHDRAIVRSIIGLVREIGLTATADGVETGAQADVLIALGCIRHQGHLYSRALPASEFDTYLVHAMADRFEQQVGALSAAPQQDHPIWPDGNG